MRFVITFLLLPAALDAEPHRMSNFFEQSKCSEIVATIDYPSPRNSTLEQTLVGTANMAMAFGYLLGFQAAIAPLNGDRETVLQNFRQFCEISPEKTGLQILEEMSGR